jgi:death-on-curing protein
MVDGFHDLQVDLFGGSHGTRDGGAIDAALARPMQKWHYGDGEDWASLAATYGYGLCQNHGYIDGNKRVAFLSLATFLDLNGWDLVAEEVDIVLTITALASGQLSEADLAEWIRARITPL